MKILVKYKDSLELPKRAHDPGDMGYDVKAMSEPKIVGIISQELTALGVYDEVSYIEYDTGLQIATEGVRVQTPGEDYVSRMFLTHVLVFPRSSVTKYNLILKNCIPVIDSTYRGNIILRFAYLWQPQDLSVIGGKIVGSINRDKVYKQGDKIAQLCPFNPQDADFEFSMELPETVRGSGSFGSSGN